MPSSPFLPEKHKNEASPQNPNQKSTKIKTLSVWSFKTAKQTQARS